MPTPGEPRSTSRIGIIVVVLVALGGVWWWTHRRSDAPATSSVTQSQQTPSASHVAAPRGTALEPARLAIAISDDAGPLAGAAVRLAPSDGEVVVVTSGRDGVAHADHLEPGTWRISASAADHAPGALPPHSLAAGADDRVAIKLAAGGRSLSGTVSDATGGPIAGARIDAAR
ncbi:MAG TPA: carboxypeptidase-like regulatory domain-containing protein, partial [Kofleriaceae bacterium]